MPYETIEYNLDGFIGVLKINRPKAYNALNAQVIAELGEAISEIDKDPQIRCLIITGACEKSFVAGADIKELAPLSEEDSLELSKKGQRVFTQIEDLNIPVIAAVNGFALGGGFELALSCDFIIASKKAKFGLPEVNLGLLPGYGGTQRLKRLVGLNNARYITFTADMFSAKKMKKMGAVTLTEEPEELMSKCLEVAQMIASRGPKAVGYAKRAILGTECETMSGGLLLEAELFSKTFTTEDKTEGIKAFLEKRTPEFKGN